MADERYDIEISDKVSSSVEKKLNGIAKAALEAFNNTERLKSSLASINSGKLDNLQAASTRMSGALTKEAAAHARLQASVARAQAQEAQATVTKERLATETLRQQ